MHIDLSTQLSEAATTAEAPAKKQKKEKISFISKTNQSLFIFRREIATAISIAIFEEKKSTARFGQANKVI